MRFSGSMLLTILGCFIGLVSVADADEAIGGLLRPAIGPAPAKKPFEMGLRYWVSEGTTDYAINSSELVSTLGNPTSILTYDNLDARSAEFLLRLTTEDDTFFKGFVGGGWLNSGTLDDEDYSVGQVKFSDTYSEVQSASMFYATVDAGQSFVSRSDYSEFALSPFLGVNYWNELINAYGLRCNPDDVGGVNCGSPGDVTVPFSTKVISDDISWVSLRLGVEASAKLFDRFIITGEAVWLPATLLVNYDSHHLRPELGPTPNGRDSGHGDGYQLEAAVSWDILPQFNIGGGVRYWHLEASGTSEFLIDGTKAKLNQFTSERFGVFGQMSYKFGD